MKNNLLSTIVTTLAIIVMTFFVLTAMQRSQALYAGIVLVVCLLTFAVVLSVDATSKQKRKGYIN
jgi:hypothetical protein